MKKVRFTELVKFVAFMATLAGSLEGSGSRGETDRAKTKKLSARRSSCSLVLVSTLDGKLSALDARNNGKLRWSLPAFSGPLLSSSLSSAQVAKHMRLIPSLDGALYQVNGDKVEPIPFSADTLLGSFYTLPDASILVGGKEAISCGIDPHSGKVRYICSADGCQLTDSEGQVQNSDVLVIKRTQQTIRAVDQRSGVERWNFSVGQQDLSFLGAAVNDGGEHHCPDPDEELPMEWSLRVSVPNGLVAAVHTHGMRKAATNNVVLWSQKFESPVAAVWRLNGDLIKQVDLLSKEVMPELSEAPAPDVFPRRPVMYIGKYEGQVYIQTSELFDPAVNTAQRVGAGLSSNAVARQSRQVIWKPYLTSSPSRTPTVVTKDLAVWNPMDYPFDNGFYLYGEVLPVIPPHNKDNQLLVVDPDPGAAFERNKHNSSESTIDGNEDSVWWHGVAFVTVAVAVVVQFLINFLHGANRRKLEAVVDYKRMPSNTLTAMSSTASLETIKGPPTPTSLGSTNSLTPSNSFVSRYLTDFEHELCLGKGGFGLVFQAKNKVDDCRYAIKRIRLPNCEQAREKVMREVKALAKLEHPGIVRYFQSWFEAPPIGWQEEIDAKMHEQGTYCGLPSESPSFGSGIVMNVHVSSTDDLYIDQQASSCGNDLQDLVNNFVRRRRKSRSIGRSGHSSYNTNGNEDDASERINGEVFDIHQLENKAFLVGQENSDSISIEFHSSSNSGLIQPQNGFFGSGGMEDSASHSVIFQDSGASENKVVSVESISFTSNSCEHSDSTQSSSSKDCCFNSSHHSLLSREGHKCQNTECNADRLSAPLYLYIQMQLCQQESLKDWLRATTKRSRVYCLNVFEQILCAVEYFHDRGLMHRDLKPSNIFFSLDGSVKVGDFGLVTAHSSENNSDTPIKDTNAFIDDINHTGQVGTQLYMSPEQIEGKAYSHKVDIFSLGLIFFELFCPFSTQMERIKVMRDVKKRVFPGDFEVKMPLQAELVRWLLSTTPKARPHATEVKNSVILRQIRQNSLNLEPQG